MLTVSRELHNQHPFCYFLLSRHIFSILNNVSNAKFHSTLFALDSWCMISVLWKWTTDADVKMSRFILHLLIQMSSCIGSVEVNVSLLERIAKSIFILWFLIFPNMFIKFERCLNARFTFDFVYFRFLIQIFMELWRLELDIHFNFFWSICKADKVKIS